MKYILITLIFVSICVSLMVASQDMYSQDSDKPKLLSVSKIWDQAHHSAFTDLIEYQGSLFCCFREGDKHVDGATGSIRILKSENGSTWDSVAVLSKKGFDLRDPHFSITPDDLLMLSLDGSVYGDKKNPFIGFNSMVSFSADGITWSDIIDLQMTGEWIWRVSWLQEIGYGVSYRLTDPSDIEKPWIATLYETADGISYLPVTNIEVGDHPSETTLRFLSDGTMVAMARQWGNGWIGTASPPYTTWKWTETGTRFGGPNFIILPNGEMWGASRLSEKKGKKVNTYTAVGRMTTTSYSPELILPSGGDTGYPGMVYRDGILYVSYYSSHEDKSSIYIAQIQLPVMQEQDQEQDNDRP